MLRTKMREAGMCKSRADGLACEQPLHYSIREVEKSER